MKRKVLEIKLDPDSTKWALDRAEAIQRLIPKHEARLTFIGG